MIIAVPARAKLNLDLEVVGRRPDGFHDLRTTLQTIELHDVLIVEVASETTLDVSGMQVDVDDNSVLKAHRALERATRTRLPAGFHVHKRIPPGSGMGGASSDAAAALRGLKAMFGLAVDLRPIAERIGADVSFFLYGGRMRAGGRGERLAPQPVEPVWFAVAWPGIELSTAAVYRAWDEMKSTQAHGGHQNLLTEAAFSVDRRVQDFATRLGGDWRMTGSGSAFFKPCESERDAKRLVASLDCWTVVAQAVGPWA